MKKLLGFTFVFLIVATISLNTSVILAFNGNANNQNVLAAAVFHGPPLLNSDNGNNWINGAIFKMYPVNVKLQKQSVNLNVDIGQAVLRGNFGKLVGNWQNVDVDISIAQNLQSNLTVDLLNSGQVRISNVNPRSFSLNSITSNTLNANITSANLNNNITNVQLVNIAATLVNTDPEGCYNEAQSARSATTVTLSNNTFDIINITAENTTIAAGSNIQPQYNMLC